MRLTSTSMTMTTSTAAQALMHREGLARKPGVMLQKVMLKKIYLLARELRLPLVVKNTFFDEPSLDEEPSPERRVSRTWDESDSQMAKNRSPAAVGGEHEVDESKHAPSDPAYAAAVCKDQAPSENNSPRGMLATGQSLAAAKRPKKTEKEAGDKAKKKEEAYLRQLNAGNWEDGMALQLAFQESGSRAIQRALKQGKKHVQARIHKDCKGQVWRMIGDPHAHHVLSQSVDEANEETIVGYIAEETLPRGYEVATHEYGCRVVGKMVRREWRSPLIRLLLKKVFAMSNRLWREQYGTYVVQATITHGTGLHQRQVIDVLIADWSQSDVCRVIRDPADEGEVNGIFVVAEVLTRFESEFVSLAEMLVEDKELLRCLVHRKFGFVLLKALLQLEESLVDKLQHSLEIAWAEVAETNLTNFQERMDKSPCEQCKQDGIKCAACRSVSEKLMSVLGALKQLAVLKALMH